MLPIDDKNEHSGLYSKTVNEEINADNNDLNVKIDVYDKASSKLIGKYQPNKITGRYTIILPPGDYNVDFLKSGLKKHSENFIIEDIAFVHDEEMNEEMGMTAVETIGGQEEHEIFKANGRYFFAAVVEINLAIAAKGSAEDNLGQFTVNNFVVVGDVDAVLVHYYFVCHD